MKRVDKKLLQQVAASGVDPNLFLHYLRQLNDAQEGSGYNQEVLDADPDMLDMADHSAQMSADQLAQKVQLRNMRWQQLEDRARFVRINPSSALQGVLGGQQEISHGQNAQVALWGAADDAETLPVTVTYGPVQQIAVGQPVPDGPPTIAPFHPFGIVRFGTRGFLVEAEVDIRTGTQFTISGSEVSVQVALEPVPAGSGLLPGTMKLAGMLSFYDVEKDLPVTRTRRIENGIAPGGIATVSVPPFASRFWVVSRDNDVLGVSVRDSNNVGIMSFTTGAVPVVQPLPGEAVYVRITAGGGGAGPVQVIFELQF